MGLSEAQVAQFHEQGFLIIEHLLEAEELEAMRKRAEEIARGELPEGSRVKRQVEPAVQRGE
ncbi:MAG TPA: phytanoyl-CoA dioxygenase family protein, partial [Chloroflexota bacterium]|nr:phytanoyl-CoA dioxygenase family protein [Chloroflexota bacterium]